MIEFVVWLFFLWIFKRKCKIVIFNFINLFDILFLNYVILLFLWVIYVIYIGCIVELCEIINYYLNVKYKIYM